ncbi:hypothetical protein [Nannocystis radixulma]|uniref:EVE domain-containing protein n=1 Tax=Nannocystis radixulma TaxID=2995305 RepID=A0ABT5BF67_9BACT|nr:hypothetical protein [Nannocystis radixulma]MDC0672789.1 hypothetical protein [Nannocystis radixulma]
MPTWLYRASNAKAGSAETWEILERFGFIHRNVYSRAARMQRVANVGSVAIGDLIHLYYAGDLNLGQDFGVFRVVDPKDHSQPALFGAPVSKSALYTIAGGTLHDRLRAAQYEPDPQLDVLCGWPVVRVEGVAPRQVSAGMMFALFPTRNSLVRATS